jgi:hypothetical protein
MVQFLTYRAGDGNRPAQNWAAKTALGAKATKHDHWGWALSESPTMFKNHSIETPSCADLLPPSGPKPDSIGAFCREALNVREYGLAVLPCGGEDGKKALVKWERMTAPQPKNVIKNWAAKPSFRQANLGILTGASGLTVVDCDTPGKLLELVTLFGETPIVITTPRGGLHLYYRSRGEASGVVVIDGLKIDIKAAGGMVVAPPSARLMDDGTVRSYRFLEGNWEWVQNLPEITPGALSERLYRTGAPANGLAPNKVPVGERNNTLFSALLRLARHVESQDALLAEALQIVESFAEPLNLSDVQATVGSVWRYKAEGRLFSSSAPEIQIPVSVQKLLCATPGGADAFMLLGVLLASHGARTREGKTFAIVAEAMQGANVIEGWGARRYRAATKVLVELKLLTQTHKGGKRRGDPHHFMLVTGHRGIGCPAI